MLEENGGWISWEAPKHNMEMANVIIEVMAKCITEDAFHVFRARIGDILPPNVKRNFTKFLIKNWQSHSKIDSQVLLTCISILEG